MPQTRHYAPKSVIFMLMGSPYVVPAAWVASESQNISNTVQQTSNPQYEPALRFSSSSLSIELHVPTQLDRLQAGTNRLLKQALKTLCESLACEQYANIDYDKEIPVDAVGKVISPFSRVRDPEDPQAKWQSGAMQPLMNGYVGHTHHMLMGYVTSFSSRLLPNTGTEVWNIAMESVNMAVLRQKPPKHEGVPEASDGANVYSVQANTASAKGGNYT